MKYKYFRTVAAALGLKDVDNLGDQAVWDYIISEQLPEGVPS